MKNEDDQQGAAYMGFSSLEHITNKPQLPHITLSPQELKVVQGITSGYTSKEIGRSLGISVYTVESYMSRIKQKLKCRNRAEIIAACFTSGIIEQQSLE